jgi:hypothetical protein
VKRKSLSRSRNSHSKERSRSRSRSLERKSRSKQRNSRSKERKSKSRSNSHSNSHSSRSNSHSKERKSHSRERKSRSRQRKSRSNKSRSQEHQEPDRPEGKRRLPDDVTQDRRKEDTQNSDVEDDQNPKSPELLQVEASPPKEEVIWDFGEGGEVWWNRGDGRTKTKKITKRTVRSDAH